MGSGQSVPYRGKGMNTKFGDKTMGVFSEKQIMGSRRISVTLWKAQREVSLFGW